MAVKAVEARLGCEIEISIARFLDLKSILIFLNFAVSLDLDARFESDASALGLIVICLLARLIVNVVFTGAFAVNIENTAVDRVV